jgi:hypothetical protein
MMTQPTMCLACVHYRQGPQAATDDGVNCCTAYPFGIPPEISSGKFDHRNEAPDDNGVRFEPDPKQPKNVASVLGWFDSKE